MDEELKDKIELLFVAQVVSLAKIIEAEKHAKGQSSSDHYIPEAIKLIYERREKIMTLLLKNHS